jgi:hydrogenase expression/formation protein HypE
MSGAKLASGKLPVQLLRELLHSDAPPPPELLLPPKPGEDAGVIALGGGALVVAGDPVTMTGADVGAHAVLVNANDIAVLGVRPRWFLSTILLPEGIEEDEIRALFAGMKATLARHDILLVGGHIEITGAVRQTVVSGHILGFAEDGQFLRTADMKSGDAVLQIGPAPVEAAAVLANEAPAAERDIAPDLWHAALSALETPGILVVEAALRATALGAHALHDPTEGGLSAGLHELAEASDLALRLDENAVLWFAPGEALCRSLGADPWGALASGALLAAFPAERAVEACRTLAAEGFPAAIIARAEPGKGVLMSDGQGLPRYERDEVLRVLDEN